MPDDSEETGPQCSCCAFHGLYRVTRRPDGLCLMCAAFPANLHELAHRMAAKYEEADGA